MNPLIRPTSRTAVGGLLALLLVSGAPFAEATFPITIRDDMGVEHRFAAAPRRIVTMLPSHAEAVWALGGGARLVGVDRHTNWPADLAALPRLGGIEDAQIESIARLAPDLIIASPMSRAVDRLDALGYRVVRIKSETHEDVRRTLVALGELLDLPGSGERVWAHIDAEVTAASLGIPPAARGQRVYFEIGSGSHAAGAGSFIGETLTRLGLVNIVPADVGPFPKLNPEFVVRARPDIVIGQAHDVAGMIDRPGWHSIPALQGGRQCGFAPAQFDVLIRPGPRLGEAARLLADCIKSLP